jgi:hypothetical protein
MLGWWCAMSMPGRGGHDGDRQDQCREKGDQDSGQGACGHVDAHRPFPALLQCTYPVWTFVIQPVWTFV